MRFWTTMLRGAAGAALCVVGFVGEAPAQAIDPNASIISPGTFDLGDGNSITITRATSSETGGILLIGTTRGPAFGGGGDFSVSTTVNPRTTDISGFFTTGGTSSSISCTIDNETGAIVSGNCGEFGGFFGAGTQTGAIANASQGTNRSAARAVTSIISNRVRNVVRDIVRNRGGRTAEGDRRSVATSGLSAGTADRRIGVWLDGSGSHLENNAPVGGYEGYGITALAGVDYNFDNTWVVGFTVGYNRTDLSLNTALGGNRIANAPTFGPYVSYIINRNFAVDANVTYARVLTELSTGGASPDANRLTTGVNLNTFWDVGPTAVTGFIGYAYSIEDPDTPSGAPAGTPGGFTRFGALKVGGEVAYPIGAFEPYLPITYEYQTTDSRDGTGRHGVVVGLGARYIGDNFTAGIQATTLEGKTNARDINAAVNVRFSF